MNEELIKTIKELEIKTAPEEHSLQAANQLYTKKQLTHFIERHDLPIAKSWLKDEIVTALSDWMADAQKELLANNQDLLTFYQNNVLQANEPLNTYNAELSDSDLEKITQLIEYGLVYNVGGELWAPERNADTVSSDVESPATSEEGTTEEKSEAVSTHNDSPKKQTNTGTSTKKAVQSPSSSLSTEKTLAQNKQTRLKYLREQAKKKKRKKKK